MLSKGRETYFLKKLVPVIKYEMTGKMVKSYIQEKKSKVNASASFILFSFVHIY